MVDGQAPQITDVELAAHGYGADKLYMVCPHLREPTESQFYSRIVRANAGLTRFVPVHRQSKARCSTSPTT